MRKTLLFLAAIGVVIIALASACKEPDAAKSSGAPAAAARPPGPPPAPPPTGKPDPKLAGKTDAEVRSELSAHLACHALSLADELACADYPSGQGILEKCRMWFEWLPQARTDANPDPARCGPDTDMECPWRNQALNALRAGDAQACPEPLRGACRVVLGQGNEDACGTAAETLGMELHRRGARLTPEEVEDLSTEATAVARPTPTPPPPAGEIPQAHKLKTALENVRQAREQAKLAVEKAREWTKAERKAASLDGKHRSMQSRELRHLEFIADNAANLAERRIENAMSELRQALPFTTEEAKAAYKEAKLAEAEVLKARLAVKQAAAQAQKIRNREARAPAGAPEKTP